MKRLALIIIISVVVGLFVLTRSKIPLVVTPNRSPLKAVSIDFSEKVTVTPTAISDYLSNPGIGWQEAHTLNSPLLPETVAYRRPQYSWKAQNPTQGVFNWAPIDADLASSIAQGKQFSFRVYSANASPQVPDWVIAKGATIKGSNPDYSSCTYQDEWGKFVTALKTRYDGNSNIAFIDISGYGNYNEWGWIDDQTVFDGNISNPSSIDGQARKRIADAFIGGSGTVTCHTSGGTQSVSYSYPGFTKTQLIMPFAGISESSHYVASKRANVGFRDDCLGRADTQDLLLSKISDIVTTVWQRAPVVYEFCGNNSTTPDLLSRANTLLKLSHGSITHDNFSGSRSLPGLTNILLNIGYRYLVKEASWFKNVPTNSTFDINTTWSNVGLAPSYLRMGDNFILHYYLTSNDTVLVDTASNENIASWFPGNKNVTTKLTLPDSVTEGTYQIKTAIINARTGKPINLAFTGRDPLGHYLLGKINVVTSSATLAPTPTATPSLTPTPTPSPLAQVLITATPSPVPTATTTATSVVVNITPTPTSVPTQNIANRTTNPSVLSYQAITNPSPTPIVNIVAPSTLPQTGIDDQLNIAILASGGVGLLLAVNFRLK